MQHENMNIAMRPKVRWKST